MLRFELESQGLMETEGGSKVIRFSGQSIQVTRDKGLACLVRETDSKDSMAESARGKQTVKTKGTRS